VIIVLADMHYGYYVIVEQIIHTLRRDSKSNIQF
jgi:hypothetical protein